MEGDGLLRRVRRIEIKTRRLSANMFAGEYHSAFKGRGMAFSEVREYHYGDDVRDIDWNVTARFNKPYIKVYEEERELTLMLLIDVSGSLDYGTVATKRGLVAEIAATLAFSALYNHDKIGVIFFSDRIESYIPPQSGRSHILHIIHEILCFQARGRNTDIGQALRFFLKIQRRQSVAFILSDFLSDKDFSHELSLCSRKHDFNAIQVYDKSMRSLPDIGIVKLCDLENGVERYVDTSWKKAREAYHSSFQKRQELLSTLFKKNDVRNVSIGTDEDYIRRLISLF